ncbi:hypothetical protein BCF74_1027 [Knoellia remsis]|uniref:Uncharacterized protein n=1 Tax=Knoellia remsis TaxID=407159 RepID=A0A2T0UZ37_9MICO|nr:hypothetical protein [Knoellia remsis]PRY63176.1 hypothetical protein BCF74_1027 [Knoellia remsis]
MTQIEVSYPGMRNLKSAADLNAGYLADIHTFVTGNCSDASVFTGFLSLFKGQYEEAYTTAETSLSKGKTSSAAIATNIDNNRRRYRDDDLESSSRLKGITVSVEVPQIPGTTPESGPLVTKSDKNVANGAGVVEKVDEGVRKLEEENGIGPRHRGPGRGNPFPIISIIGEGESALKTIKDGQGAVQDERDYENFENEGQR